jgi:hypothetical protein
MISTNIMFTQTCDPQPVASRIIFFLWPANIFQSNFYNFQIAVADYLLIFSHIKLNENITVISVRYASLLMTKIWPLFQEIFKTADL